MGWGELRLDYLSDAAKRLDMTEEFVHLDRLGSLDAGDVLELDWSFQLANDEASTVTGQDRSVLRELYPEGLSRHGVRYASMVVAVDQNVDTPGKSEPVVAFLDTIDQDTDGVFTEPRNPMYEWCVELVRLSEFPECKSRFQSIFGWESRDQIDNLPKGGTQEQQVVKVRCESYSRRDMELLGFNSFSNGLSDARRYWRGEPSGDPSWEIVMEPPVEVIEVL